MTLRWRLAAILATVAALTVGATTVIAYRSVADRLLAETDRSLAERTALLPAVGRLLAETERPGRAMRGAAARGGVAELVRSDTELQLLDPDGTVVQPADRVDLPVTDRDRRIAASGTSGRPAATTRSATVDGEPYRIRTVGLVGGGAAQLAVSTQGDERVLTELRRRFALLGAAIVVAAATLGWLAARRTARPLERLTHAAEEIANAGDVTAVDPDGVDVGRRDETGRLARSFRSMLEALTCARADQQRLVQDAAHELRTPLTSLRTNLDVLDRFPDLDADRRSALVGDLRSELADLGTLVEELVQLAAEGRDGETPVAVALDDIVERVADRAARRHGRPFTVAGRGALLIGRPGSIERAVTNLCDNAAKFSPAGAPVEITLDGRSVTVRDHGPGIADEDLPRIFDRFYRSVTARTLPGSGLGLSIVQQVATSHGGRAVAANHPDGGAVVGITLGPSAADA
ncbi:MAG: HAMP domain-containing protein [Actinobacteria bacterium]|nr:HAMP domain-containing protein [Actinomycetota bacterium]